MASSLIASPRKLPNGQWGAYCAAAKVGDLLTIRTAAGKEWQARVVDITDAGVCITCSTGCRCGSVEEFSKPTDCWTCRHDS